MTLDRVRPKLTKDQKIVAVCGPSSGDALWLRGRNGGAAVRERDGISNGRLIFVEGGGASDVFYRDAGNDFSSARADGGLVSVIPQKRVPASSWIVSYSSTGVVETHNLAFGVDGKLVNMWTSSKPDGLNPAHVFTFSSNCVQP